MQLRHDGFVSSHCRINQSRICGRGRVVRQTLILLLLQVPQPLRVFLCGRRVTLAFEAVPASPSDIAAPVCSSSHRS